MLEYALEVEVEICGVNPKAPVKILEEGHFEKIQLLEGDTAYVSYEVIPIEHIIVEFRSH